MKNDQRLSTHDAISQRRSIRKFKSDPIDDDVIHELLEAARLAPSGCNSQPWRFKIVKDAKTKQQLQALAFDQKFISQAPVVLVVCVDVLGYLEGRISGVQDMGEIDSVSDNVCEVLNKGTQAKSKMGVEAISASVAFNAAIAVEHIALRALDFELGTCWMRLINEKAIRELFGWDNHITPVALLPIGTPDEAPTARKRRPLEELIID